MRRPWFTIPGLQDGDRRLADQLKGLDRGKVRRRVTTLLELLRPLLLFQKPALDHRLHGLARRLERRPPLCSTLDGLWNGLASCRLAHDLA